MNLPASVLATSHLPTLSERYVQVNTADIVQRMERSGFYVAKATSTAPRTRDPMYAKHVIDFRLKNAERIHGAEPRVIFVNSHDGTTAATAMAGLYRFVCSNGLVVGHTVEKLRQRHAGDAAANLIERMQQLARQTEQVYTTVERWARIECADKDVEVFAKMAAQLRWGDAHMFEPEEIARPRRREDERNDLWTVFNRIQESTIRGGLEGYSRSGRRATSRPLTDISRDVEYNANLWTLAEEFEQVLA